MNRKLFLLFSIFAAVPFGIQAQTNAPKPVAVRWITGETGASNTEGDRPRIVPEKAEAVGASVEVNVKTAERIAFELVNQKRAENGLKPLAWSDSLENIARLHSADMAELEYFSHRSPAGKMVSDRADDAHLGAWRAIGENIAFNRGYADPITKAVELWLNSPGHKRNMMSDTWKESAIGVAIAEDGSYYFTQVFLARK